MAEVSLVKLHSDECHWTLLMIRVVTFLQTPETSGIFHGSFHLEEVSFFHLTGRNGRNKKIAVVIFANLLFQINKPNTSNWLLQTTYTEPPRKKIFQYLPFLPISSGSNWNNSYLPVSSGCPWRKTFLPEEKQPNDDNSTTVQVMAWCRQATCHHLSQCWPRIMSPFGVTRPQWVNLCQKSRIHVPDHF